MGQHGSWTLFAACGQGEDLPSAEGSRMGVTVDLATPEHDPESIPV